jgi:hypothetical protein
MSEQVPENINIYLSNPNTKKEILGDSGPLERYIILMNDILQSKNQEYIKSIQTMESKIEELEEELTIIERKHEYSKSLIKNFHEMNKLWKHIGEKRLFIENETKNNIKTYKNKLTKYMRIGEIFTGIYIAIFSRFFSLGYTLNLFILLLLIISSQEYFLFNLKIPEFNETVEKIKKLTDEIKKTSTSQDYIHEFIDAL